MEEIQQMSFTLHWVERNLEYLAVKKTHIASLAVLVNEKIISSSMSSKIAGSGLSLNHLKIAYTRNRLSGIRNLLSEKFEDIVRVTVNTKIINNINTWFQNEEISNCK